jgi:hypothetical protein
LVVAFYRVADPKRRDVIVWLIRVIGEEAG